MRIIRPVLLPCLSALALAVLPLSVPAQLVQGQYETEAPVGSWNTFPFLTAPSLGRGETSYAFASDSSCALANPALAARLPKLTLGLNGSLRRATIFRFGPVNTGVFTSRENLTIDLSALDWVGLSFRLGRWAVAFNAALIETYDRPSIAFDYYEEGRLLYSYKWNQTGLLRTFHLSLARELRPNLAVGLGLGLLSGSTGLTSEESYAYAGYVIRDDRDQDLSGFTMNAGILWEPLAGLRLALAVRAPFSAKAASESALSYTSVSAGAPIVIRGSSRDKSRLPATVGAGVCWSALPRLQWAVDLTFIDWMSYRFQYFGETKTRAFRNSWKLGTGVEYEPEIRLWGAALTLPFRAGIVYDSQPMRDPRSGVLGWTVGTGVAWNHLRLDLGASFGSENGSGRKLRTIRTALALGYRL